MPRSIWLLLIAAIFSWQSHAWVPHDHAATPHDLGEEAGEICWLCQATDEAAPATSTTQVVTYAGQASSTRPGKTTAAQGYSIRVFAQPPPHIL